MGGNLCGENIFKKLTEEYGDDFVKFIVAEKSKTVIKEKFSELTSKSNQKFDDFQAQTNSTVEDKTNQLDRIFQSAKNSVDSTLPGGISMVQRIKGQSIKQFSGYNQLQSSIDSIKDQTIQKLNTKRGQVMGELTSKKNGMISKIENERPKVPLYEDLPDVAKKQILKKGEKEFKQQIVENKEKAGKQALSQFNPQMLNKIFGSINPQGALDGIVKNAYNRFVQNMSGASGGLSGFVSGVF